MSKYRLEDVTSVDNPKQIQDGSQGTETYKSPFANTEEYKAHVRATEMNHQNDYKLVPPLDLTSTAANSKNPMTHHSNWKHLTPADQRFSIQPLPLYLN